jgi:hypothetical protein
MKLLKISILFVAIILIPTISMSNDLVFHGKPFKRSIIQEMAESSDSVLTDAEGIEYEVKIIKRGDMYFWASRKNTPLTLIDGGGAYIIFDGGGSGFIKILKPFMYSLRKGFTESQRLATGSGYVEVLTRQFAVFVYHGNEVSVNLSNENFGMDSVEGLKDLLPQN